MPHQPGSALTRHQISAMIVRKAWHDPFFHQRLLADPTAAYEQATGQKVPSGVRIAVVEDDAHTVHFVIPARPADARGLSDSDLEAVAGGMGIVTLLHPGTPVLPPDPVGHGPIIAPMSPKL